MRALVSTRRPGTVPTASERETALLQVIRRHGLEEPVRQFRVVEAGVELARVDLVAVLVDLRRGREHRRGVGGPAQHAVGHRHLTPGHLVDLGIGREGADVVAAPAAGMALYTLHHLLPFAVGAAILVILALWSRSALRLLAFTAPVAVSLVLIRWATGGGYSYADNFRQWWPGIGGWPGRGDYKSEQDGGSGRASTIQMSKHGCHLLDARP